MVAQTVACPYCGGEIPPMARKCRHCGEWLGAKEPGTMRVPIRRFGIALGLATGFYAVELALAFGAYLLANGNSGLMGSLWLGLSWMGLVWGAYWWQGRK